MIRVKVSSFAHRQITKIHHQDSLTGAQWKVASMGIWSHFRSKRSRAIRLSHQRQRLAEKPSGTGFHGCWIQCIYYEQIEGDSGSGAKLGGFEGRDIGIGPALGYILQVGENTLVAEARWLPGLETKRRLEGDFFWLKLVYQF